jgi:hypothetical protein
MRVALPLRSSSDARRCSAVSLIPNPADRANPSQSRRAYPITPDVYFHADALVDGVEPFAPAANAGISPAPSTTEAGPDGICLAVTIGHTVIVTMRTE